MSNKGIYQHYRKEEHPFIDQALSWKEDVERTYRYRLTDFLNPREQQIIQAVIGNKNDDLQVKAFGGGPYTERKRMIIAPFYEEITEDMFQISLKEATFHKQFVTLSHRDVLGSFLSLGIVREKLGDIFITDDRLQLLIDQQISTYVQMNLKRMKNTTIQLKEQSLHHLIERKEEWDESLQTVSSLRLDVVLKEIYHLSRRKADEIINRGAVKVNFKTVDQGAFLLEEGDLLSVRGHGRSKIFEQMNKTRKGKIRLRTGRLK